MRAPAANRRDDLGAALPADVDPEHMHAGLRVAVELQRPNSRGDDRSRLLRRDLPRWRAYCLAMFSENSPFRMRAAKPSANRAVASSP